MKFIVISFIAILLIHESFGAPKPFFDSFGNIVNGIGDRIYDGINSITKGITGLTVHGIDSMQELRKHIINAFRVIINRNTNSNIVRIIDQTKNKLTEINNRETTLIAAGERKLNNTEQKVKKNIEKVKADLHIWSNKQAQKAKDSSPAVKNEIDRLCYKLMNSSLTEAQACGAGIMQLVEDLHKEGKKAVESSFPLIDNIINNIRNCANLDQRNNRATSQCASDVRKKLDLLSPLLGQYSKLVSRLNRLSVDLLRAPCVAETQKYINERKLAVAEQIDYFLKRYKEKQVSTTAASTKSITVVGVVSPTPVPAEVITEVVSESTTVSSTRAN